MNAVWLSLVVRTVLGSSNAPAVGPFSGVSVDNITATPLLQRDEIFAAQGPALAALGQGMEATTSDGQAVVLTKPGFALEFASELAPGRYTLEVCSSAPDGSTDSLWVAVDGTQLTKSFNLPVEKIEKHSTLISIGEGGKHTVRLTLREKPGCVIASVSLSGISCKAPRPAMRDDMQGQHPRLLINRDSLAKLKARLADPRVQRFYKPAGPRSSKPPAFKAGGRNGGGFRTLHDYALSHLLEPKPEKLKGILRWLDAATTYPDCGADLDAEYFLEGVALCYDWLYDQIPPELRARVRDTILRHGRVIYAASLAGHSGGGHNFQQNHFWYSHLALTLAAASLYGEVPEARQWLAWSWDRYERIALTFSPDGSFHEGPGYWSFSMPTLYLFTELYEQCTGLRFPGGDRGLMGQGEFRFHYQYPGLHETAALEDSTAGKGAVPIATLLWEAKRFKSVVPMGIATRLAHEPGQSSWDLLWLDESVPAANIEQAVPRARYYHDVETAFARTSWADDASYVALMCRPLGGHVWSEFCRRFELGGTGHNHPEQNHFVLFGRGEVLVGDTGYVYDKQTHDHNTVLVDGKGQFGDGEMWPGPTPGRAHITQSASSGDVTLIVGDATSAYPKQLGLTQFERTLVLAGPDLAVVRDRLSADQPRVFSWLLHHYGKVTHNGDTWQIVRNKALLGVQPLVPRQLTVKEATYRPKYIHPTRSVAPKEADVQLVQWDTPRVKQTNFLVPLQIGAAGDKLPMVSDVSNDSCEAVRSGDTVVAFSRGPGGMKVLAPWGETLETNAFCLVARLQGATHQVIELPAKP